MRPFLRKIAIPAFIVFVFVSLTPKTLGFSDVSSYTEYGEAIESLLDRGVVEGYSDGSFRPGSTINRAEFLKIVLEGRGEDQDFEGEDCFPDVSDEWFAMYVCTAKDEGIIDGYPDGTFKPEREINFVEASKIIANAFGQEMEWWGNDWFESYVRALEGSNAIPPSVERLDQPITRGEMSEMIWRLSEDVTDEPTKAYLNVKYPEMQVNLATDEPQQAKSCTDLAAFTKEMQFAGRGGGMGIMEEAVMAVPLAGDSAPVKLRQKETGTDDYSETNVQVEGVDEADIVKTDGTYLYIVSRGNIRIVRAHPADVMENLSTLTVSNDGFHPSEVYIDGNNLVIIGTSQRDAPHPRIMPEYWAPSYSNTEVRIYDVTDRRNPTLKRKVGFEGRTVSSRRIDDKLYMVVNQSPRWRGPIPVPLAEDLLPRYEDSATGEEAVPVARCGDVTILPHPRMPQYITVAVIPIRDKSAVKREVILGNGDNIYMSLNNLYVANTEWFYNWRARGGSSKEKTTVMRFAVSDDGVTFKKKGSIPGRILNQFSMDEFSNYFRIATTEGNAWDETDPSMNHLYILNMEMEQVGAVEDIAPGEQIYSARFMGERAYMVTFKKVDPFFVIDVSDPYNPKILGKLKIPGYSDYLHPYDRNHVIGFGKEAEEMLESEGQFAWYQGMKVAIFDVTDVSKPKELHKVVIGDRGTSSPLLYNHKALLFDKDRNLLAFPVTIHEIPPEQKTGRTGSTYGSPVFQGAIVYDLTLANGFVEKGKITHLDDDVFIKAGDFWYQHSKNVQRIVRIEDSLLTISDGELQSHNIDSVDLEGKVEFPEYVDEVFFDELY